METARQAADPTVEATIGLQFLGHATTLVELGGLRVLTDPFLGERLGLLRRHGPIPSPAELDVDIVVISHGHPDHFDTASLDVLPGSPLIVVPRGLGLPLWRETGLESMEIQDGERVDVRGLGIVAVPARHRIGRGAPPAQPVGYVLAADVLDADVRVYFAGDTGPLEGLAAWVRPSDLALLPVSRWGSPPGSGQLTARAAAELAAEIEPRAAVPIHWGTLYPAHLDKVWPGPLRQPGERFAEQVRQLAPGVDVRVLRPGEATTFERSGADRRAQTGLARKPAVGPLGSRATLVR